MNLRELVRTLSSTARRATKFATTGWRRQALAGLFVIASIAIIANLIIGNWDLFAEYEWQFRPGWLAVVIIFFFLDFALALFAWHLLVSRLAGFRNLRRSVKIYLQSNLARRIPGSVWYVASRAVLYEEQGVRKTTISLLSGLEMALFMISGVLITLLSLPFWTLPDDFILQSNPLIWLLFTLPLSLALIHPRILGALWRRFSPATQEEQLQWADTTTWMSVYLLTWILGGVVLFGVLNMFEPIPLSRLVHVIGIWSLANSVSLIGFVTISLFGLREVSLILLLSPLIPTPIALLVAITVRLIWLAGELATSLLSLRL